MVSGTPNPEPKVSGIPNLNLRIPESYLKSGIPVSAPEIVQHCIQGWWMCLENTVRKISVHTFYIGKQKPQHGGYLPYFWNLLELFFWSPFSDCIAIIKAMSAKQETNGNCIVLSSCDRIASRIFFCFFDMCAF